MQHQVMILQRGCSSVTSRGRVDVEQLLAAQFLRQPIAKASTVAARVSTIEETDGPLEFEQVVSEIDGSGSIGSTKDKKGVWVFLSGIYPAQLGRVDLRHRVLGIKPEDLTARLKRAIDEPDRPPPFTVDRVYPRQKDGGAFVRVVSSTGAGPVTPQMLEKKLAGALNAHGFLPWWMMGASAGVHLVKGKPWLEDMHIYPNREILVEFDGPGLSQEALWHLIRPFGRIEEIQMPLSKDPPPLVARVSLDSLRSATATRNCLHGFTYRGDPSPTTLRILYAPRLHAQTATTWLSSHPRLVLPVLAILLGGISYTFFDPIREFFIKSHIMGMFDVQQYPVFSWLQRETVGRLGFGQVPTIEPDAAGSAVEQERGDAVKQLSTWISGKPETFFIVLGPKGSGKGPVVQTVLQGRKNSLVIDCGRLIRDGANSNTVVTNLARSLGYFPQFAFLSSISNMVDLASVGLVGQKAGFATSIEDQIRQILGVAEKALKDLAEEAEASRQKSVKNQSATQLDQVTEKGGVLDSLKEAITGTTPDATLVGGSNTPVVVFKDFCTKDHTQHEALWSGLAEFASRLAENQIAHVVFTTENAGALKPLAQALSTQSVKTIVLTDASAESAQQYVSKKLLSDSHRKITLTPEHSALIRQIGGRLTDLDSLVQKIEAGMDLESAIDDIISQSMAEIQRKCFVSGNETGIKKLAWDNEQVWELIKQLAQQDEVPLHPTLIETFGGDESVLAALESTDLIHLTTQENGETVIKIGKPVYRPAIQRLLSQKKFAAYNDMKLASKKLAKAEKDIQANLSQLVEIGNLFPVVNAVGNSSGGGSWLFGSSGSRVPREIQWKVERVMEKLKEVEEIADVARKEVKAAKKVLQERLR